MRRFSRWARELGRTRVHAPCRELIDVMHLGRDRVIAAHLVRGPDRRPGPGLGAGQLDRRARRASRAALLLTHIHLDHAGATGVLVRRFPELRVYVSEVGAPHLVDPGSCSRAPARLYGEENMERLWGEVAPVPRGEHRRARGRGGGRGLPGRAHAGPRAPPRLLPRPRRRRRLRRRHGRGPDPARRLHAGADAAARDRRRGLARLGRPDRGAGARAPAADPLRRSPTTPARSSSACARACARNAERARRATARRSWARCEAEIEAHARPRDGDSLRQAVPPEQHWLGLERYWAQAGAPNPGREIPRPQRSGRTGVQGCSSGYAPQRRHR